MTGSGGNHLVDVLLDRCRSAPGAQCITEPGIRSWTYGDLERRSGQFAHALTQRGICPGDRVAVQLDKSAEVIALHIAVLRVGAVYVPMNSAYTATEIADLVGDADAALVVRSDPVDGRPTVDLSALARHADEAPDDYDDIGRTPNDPASILYTSGTTGRPKGAVMRHGNLSFSAEVLARAWALHPEDVVLHALPLFHTHGLFVAVHCALVAGASTVLLPRFDADLVVDHLPAATVFMGVPTHYVRLLATSGFTHDRCAGIRLFTSGSAPMLTATHHEFFDRTGHRIVERYGMTETCILTSNPVEGPQKPGTVGRPLPGVELRLVASGDGAAGAIHVRGPNVFDGYWGRPELNATEFTGDGWFITGDLGVIDGDGYVEIVGRSKDLVISGGLNVYPKEVELVLDSLDGVAESAVFGVPHPDFGEAVAAAMVACAGAQISGDAIRALARERLAGFKVPREILVLDELPRNAMGKVRKDVLRQMVIGAANP